MKKSILILTVLLLCVSMISCDGASESVIDRGDEIVELVSEMVNSDEYINIMLGNVSAYEDLLSEIREIDFSRATIYELKASEDELVELLTAKRGDADKLSESLKDKLVCGLGSSFASYINLGTSTEKVIISSVFNTSKSFVDKSIKENQYLLYVFESGYSMLISFVPHEDGAVVASGSLILNDSLELDNADQIEASLKALGIKTITATKLK